MILEILPDFPNNLPYFYKQKKIMNQLKNDKEIEKRKFAFKPFSFSRKFDVGRPPKVEIGKTNQMSNFRKLFLKGMIPLRMSIFPTKDVAYWTSSLDILPLENIVPCLVEGISDSNEFYQRLALSALKNIIFNWNKNDLIKWIPNLIIPLQKCFRTLKSSIISRTLLFLTYYIRQFDIAAILLLPYLSVIFRPITYFFRKDKQTTNEIKTLDNCNTIMALKKIILEFFEEYELKCCPYEIDAYYEIKSLLPTYESRKFCDVKPIRK